MSTIKVRIRNISYAPNLENEGVYLAPLPAPPPQPEGVLWSKDLTAHERLYYHQTLNSARQNKRFLQTPEIPKDSLDYRMLSRYDHSCEVFPEKVDTVLQRETCPPIDEDGLPVPTFRTLRNDKYVLIHSGQEEERELIIGGVKEKISPFSVKLICSGVHNQLVNNGYSRQNSDGNFFRY